MTGPTPAPAPGPDTPDGMAEPSQASAAGLLNGAALPVTIAGTAFTDPKIPPFKGD